MQQIARELNNSETAFVFRPPPGEGGYDLHLRFFTPVHEVPLCGHATVAAHYALAVAHGLGTSRILQKCGAGILPIDILRQADGDYKIAMTQGAVDFGEILNGAALDALLAALGLKQDDLIEKSPVQAVSTGYAKVLVGIKSRARLNGLSPHMAGLSAVSRATRCNGFYVFTLDSPDAGILTHGRMFAPVSGVDEDPVTGNASGPLGAYLVRYGLAAPAGGLLAFAARQGEAMNRAGTVYVRVKAEGRTPTEVRIAGHGVIVFRAELTLD